MVFPREPLPYAESSLPGNWEFSQKEKGPWAENPWKTKDQAQPWQEASLECLHAVKGMLSWSVVTTNPSVQSNSSSLTFLRLGANLLMEQLSCISTQFHVRHKFVQLHLLMPYLCSHTRTKVISIQPLFLFTFESRLVLFHLRLVGWQFPQRCCSVFASVCSKPAFPNWPFTGQCWCCVWDPWVFCWWGEAIFCHRCVCLVRAKEETFGRMFGIGFLWSLSKNERKISPGDWYCKPRP